MSSDDLCEVAFRILLTHMSQEDIIIEWYTFLMNRLKLISSYFEIEQCMHAIVQEYNEQKL